MIAPGLRAAAGRRAVAILALLVAAVLPGLARAASRVVLLRASGDDALTRQAGTLFAAELRAAGFEVVHADRDPTRDVRADMEATSERLQPVATIAILPADGTAAVELWLSERVTGKLVIRRIDTPGRGDDAAAELALKAVELLRGSLLEVTIERPRESTAPAPPPDVARWVAETAPDRTDHFLEGLGLTAGATMLASTGLGPAFAPMLRLSWGAPAGLAARLTLVGPGAARGARAEEGSASIRQELALVEAAYVLRPRARLQPFVAAGSGVHRVRARGTGISPLFPSEQGAALGAAFAAGGGIAARLGNHVALVLDAGGLLVLPRTRVLVATREVASAGGLSLLVAAGVAGVY